MSSCNSRDMRLTSIGGGADEVAMQYKFRKRSFYIFSPIYSHIYSHIWSHICSYIHSHICSHFCSCIFVLVLIVISGDVANHLQNDGNSSKADQKVAHWPPPPSGFHTDTNVHVYLFIREMSKRYQ